MKSQKKCAGILYSDGKSILLLKRSTKGDHFAKWSIPGGKVESGENIVSAAERESKEETGYQGGQKYGHYEDDGPRYVFHTYFYAVKKPFAVKLSDEHSEFKWVPIENVLDYDLHPRFKIKWPHFLNKIKKHVPKVVSFIEWIESKSFE
jgi:8-oxo-dGTP diphosphatase